MNEAERSDPELSKMGYDVFTNAAIMKKDKHLEEIFVF